MDQTPPLDKNDVPPATPPPGGQAPTQPDAPPPTPKGKLTPWVALIIIAIVVVLALWRKSAIPTADPPVADMPGDPLASPLVVTAPAPLPAQPVAIAKAPFPEDIRDLLGIIRLRDLASLPQRLTVFLNAIDPAIPTATILETIANLGIDPQRCRPDGNATLFAWTPEPVLSWPPRSSALVPVTSYEHAMASQLPPHFASFDRYTLFGFTPGDLDAALAMREQLYSLAQAPLPDGLAASLNVRRLWETYGSVARLQVRTLQGAAGLFLLQHPVFAQQPNAVGFISELMNSLSQALFETLDQTLHLTAAVDLDAERINLSFIAETRPDTDLAAANTVGPVAAPDLLSLLSDSDTALLVSQETVADWTATVDLLNRIMRPAIAALGDGAIAQMDALAVGLPASGRTTMATRMAPDDAPDAEPGSVAVEAIFLAQHPRALRALLESQLEQAYQTGFHGALFRLLGLETQVTAETVHAPAVDGTVRRITLALAPIDGETPLLPADALEQMSQHVVYEIASLGPYVLMTLQRPVNDLAQQIRSAAPTAPHPLFSLHPTGATAVCQFNPATLMALILDAMPEDVRSGLADGFPTTGLPPVTMAAYAQDGNRLLTVRIPTALLAALRQAAE